MAGDSKEDKNASRVDELIAQLKGSNQIKALEELGFYTGEKVKEALLGSLKSNNAGVRMQAADSLETYYAKTSDNEVVEALIQALSDPIPDVRGYVVKALGCIGLEGNTEVVGPLNRALMDVDPRVRRMAQIALGSMSKV